jgi:hypothetical protein
MTIVTAELLIVTVKEAVTVGAVPRFPFKVSVNVLGADVSDSQLYVVPVRVTPTGFPELTSV